MEDTITITAQSNDRADKILSSHTQNISRTRLQSLIKDGFLSRNNIQLLNPSEKIKEGDILNLVIPPLEEALPQPENIPLEILYEDNDLIVIIKPAGLVVHPAPGHHSGTLVNALLYHCGDTLSGIGGVKRPGIVHRLDKDTSGVMVAAKNDVTHQKLSESFADHGREGSMERIYEAFVWGIIPPQQRNIEAPIGRDGNNPERMRVTSKGKWALTEILNCEALDSKKIMSHCHIKLMTGRTHQIRVHLNHINHPVVADPVYGSGFKSKINLLDENLQQALINLNRQALHAAQLVFEHPTTGKLMEFESNLPKDMQAILDCHNNSIK